MSDSRSPFRSPNLRNLRGTSSTVNPDLPETPPIRPDLGPPSAGVQPVDQPSSGLGVIISVVVAALVFVLAILATGRPTSNRIPMLQTTGTLYWVIGAVAVAVSAAGAQYADRMAHKGDRIGGAGRSPDAFATAWIVPSVATAAAVILVATFHSAAMMVVGPLVAFLGNAGALFARDLLDDTTDPTQRTAVAIHSVVVHAVAFIAFSAIYLNKLPTAPFVVMVALVAGLLILETLERGFAPREQRVLYSVIGAFVLGESAIALNWWQTSGWTGGAVLLTLFYLASGVLLAATQRQTMRGRDVIEFGLVSAAAFVILAVTA